MLPRVPGRGKLVQNMVSSAAPSVPAPLPRYRRVLSFGDVLDESIQLFRARWLSYALMSAIALVPSGLFLVWASASGALNQQLDLAAVQSGRLPATTTLATQAAALMGTGLISGLFELLWTAAIVVTTEAYLRGTTPVVSSVYGQALRRLPVLVLASIAFIVGLTFWTILALVPLVVTLGILGSIAATIGLLVWWLRPSARRTWLKWLIILTAPFGLPTYFGIRWSMMVPVVVLEHLGPLSALRRSSQLVAGSWFWVMSILSVGSLIVSVLLYAPAALIEVPLTISSAGRGRIGLDPTETAISNGVGVLLQIVFASIGTIVYTLTFTDLRNRREGTDIAERLRQLETLPTSANG